MLALTFINKEDYDKIQEHDRISIVGWIALLRDTRLQVIVTNMKMEQKSRSR